MFTRGKQCNGFLTDKLTVAKVHAYVREDIGACGYVRIEYVVYKFTHTIKIPELASENKCARTAPGKNLSERKREILQN